jgi:hypothetical protein
VRSKRGTAIHDLGTTRQVLQEISEVGQAVGNTEALVHIILGGTSCSFFGSMFKWCVLLHVEFICTSVQPWNGKRVPMCA